MARQPYLTRLAFGRSAFEPPSQQSQAIEASQDGYVQLYNERGYPINPRARQHGRRLREAQNDVLAAIGVVIPYEDPSEEPAETIEERRQRVEKLEEEDRVGGTVALSTTLVENICTWWIGSLRDRVLTFPIPSRMQFSQVVTSEFQASESTIVYAGFPAHLLSTIAVQASVYIALVIKPFDRFLRWVSPSRKRRRSLERFRAPFNNCFRLFVGMYFYPLSYHHTLQRLGLVPARPLLPPWRAFIPFSSSSPIRPVSMPAMLTSATIVDILKATTASPLLFLCFEHFVARWVYATISEAVESSMITQPHPDRPKLASRTRRRSPLYMRNVINLLLCKLGWGQPFQVKTSGHNQGEQALTPDLVEPTPGQAAEVGELQINGLTPLYIPSATETQVVLGDGTPTRPSTPILSSHPLLEAQLEFTSPISQDHHTSNQDEDEPSIRITSREGDVHHLEVRLPARFLARHDRSSFLFQKERSTHRVTQLSSEPAQMLSAMVKAQIVTWVTLPLKIITLRLIAEHYLAGQSPGASGLGRRAIRPWAFGGPGGMNQISMRDVGVFISRVVLSGSIETVIDLGLWGCQWAVVTWIGQRYFCWGRI
ncbi:hypothetical protein GQ43DRAFT_414941 [Delitschia confertaspora ATCC 74209]|uniref:Uncharacterized protein n=1 Tax=Delitschia confertaspora ATCC 74209 TaxID=1513339 RepID=A0A9P4JM66_9PLEO|nr:hypothetical protein GQ43DRAFT_414941 [Delitschia confertaspora ATCC 74209]